MNLSEALQIRPGVTAIIGGGGKTTLASLVARFFDITEGRILIGNKDVKEIPSKQLMDMVSVSYTHLTLPTILRV